MDKIIDKNKKIDIGLTKEEVEERIKENKVNYDTSLPTKSIKTIVRENIFTLFNLINILLGVAVFCVGSYKNLLFLIVIFCNTAISIIQEINSKKAVDKLSILAQAKVNCIRDGEKQEIGINSIVLDDLLMLETGNQIVADSIILEGEVEVNESFITGESDVIYKRKGDTLLSGSFVVSGKCKAEVIHIGDENYTSKISSGAKYVKKVNSEIMKSLNGIIKIVSIAIVPIGILLFFNQLGLTENSFKNAVVNTVAAIIGMIPEGLVLLTSTVLAVSVIRLSKRKVLVQELYCIETLARVDTLCLDKTGTITEGRMEVNDIIEITKSKEELEEILSEIASASDDNNSTIEAIRAKYKNKEKWKVINKVPFSSQKKWSGVSFKDKGSYIIGAPEFVLREKYDEYKERIEKYSNDYRVIIVANSEGDFIEKELPDKLEVLGFVLISDVIRKEANKTLKYFKEQGVNIKIISGDNPITVSKIAKRAGVENSEKYINMQEIKTKEQLEKAAKEYTIFGRVTPVQKKELVQALKKEGHTVAMTGDGVNDVLALKEADCSIAMASGSDATRNVAELVLLDSNFASMPEIVLEGRRTINNIERSATLFLVKTIYASILAIIFLFVNMPYPFMPIQLTLISTVTIGIPSFVLALEPNKERIKGEFLKNVIRNALPVGLTVILNIFALTISNKMQIITEEQYSSLCVIATGICGILLLFTFVKARRSEKSKLPISIFRLLLAIVITILFVVGLTVFNWWFNIAPLMPIMTFIIKIIILSIMNLGIITIVIQKGHSFYVSFSTN